LQGDLLCGNASRAMIAQRADDQVERTIVAGLRVTALNLPEPAKH
jgi:hypothetical protein